MRALGFLDHPSVPAGLGPGCVASMPLLCKIVYRQDMQTQFSPLAGLSQYLADGAHDKDLQEALAEAAADHGDDEAGLFGVEDVQRRVDAAGLMRIYIYIYIAYIYIYVYIYVYIYIYIYK